ncbi:MAG: DUF6702 family protein [Hyphomonadaceae bacterium]
MRLLVGITRRMALLTGGACVATVALAPEALAHRAQTVLTTVMWNASSSMLEVTHRLHAHDAELTLAATTGAQSVDITQVKNQAQLLLYIEKQFTMTDGGKTIALQPLGAEMEGEAILVYQECRLATPPKVLSIVNGILRDVFEGQTNLVNVRLAQRTRTLIFSGSDGAKRAEGLL